MVYACRLILGFKPTCFCQKCKKTSGLREYVKPQMAAFGCGFNRSTQHTTILSKKRSVASCPENQGFITPKLTSRHYGYTNSEEQQWTQNSWSRLTKCRNIKRHFCPRVLPGDLIDSKNGAVRNVVQEESNTNNYR
jgi:hypothetical protein